MSIFKLPPNPPVSLEALMKATRLLAEAACENAKPNAPPVNNSVDAEMTQMVQASNLLGGK